MGLSPDAIESLTGLKIYDEHTPPTLSPDGKPLTEVRPVMMQGSQQFSPHIPLQESLHDVDGMFRNFAAHCGALVLEHTWGLRRSTDDNLMPNPYTPDKYDLVVEAEILDQVRNIRRLQYQHRAKTGLGGYEAHLKDSSTPAFMLPTLPDDFCYGKGRITGKAGLYFVGLAPRARINPKFQLSLLTAQLKKRT